MAIKGTEIAELVYEGLAENQDRSNRAHLGCSIIGRTCGRQVWYSWRWAKSPDHDGRLLRLFRRGHLEEDTVEQDLKQIGVDIYTTNPKTGKQFTIQDFGGHLGGSMDGIMRNFPNEDSSEWLLLEIKTSGLKPFTKLVKGGVKKEKPEHYAQMQLYMKYGNMKKALYFSVCKDNDKIHTELIDFNKEDAEAYLLKAKELVEAIEPPPKISEHPSWFECKWCEHSDHCHGESAPNVNCRTCIHASPDMQGEDGVWRCEKKGVELSFSDQEKGCDQHIFIPKLLPFADAVDADPNGEWVEYKSEQGVHIFNCLADSNLAGGYTSAEINRVGSRVLTDDPLVESIIRNFSGKLDLP